MDKNHHDQEKFETLIMPEGQLKAEEVDPDHFVCEEHFTYPPTQPAIPIHATEQKVSPTEEEEDIIILQDSPKKRLLKIKVEEPVSKKEKFVAEDLESIMGSD